MIKKRAFARAEAVNRGGYFGVRGGHYRTRRVIDGDTEAETTARCDVANVCGVSSSG
jgi:hypothetical protein